MIPIRSYLKLIRPKQWLKNFFIFAPLIFAKELFQEKPLLATLEAFFAFCFTASAVYIINDIADIDADRAHPEKRHRPLAARAMPLAHAYGLIIVLLGLVVVLALQARFQFVVCLGAYFVMNLAYSFKLKEVVLLDVFIIATGFMLRVLGGAYAIDVEVSSWIVLCTLFVSLFLGFAKRRGEILLNQEIAPSTERTVLFHYRVEFIDQMLTIAAAGTVISYALYTVAPRTLELFGTDKVIYTTMFVIYGIFRYLYLIHTTNSTENPTNAVTADLPILATGILWILCCVLLIYYYGHLIPGS
ncbi:MAG TPA: decaprenyl-phosphate phosphoribosyltransferase [Bacteroidota bacterium]|nr:decaprenyl-phosphate phosphoribosyltransferase [Bacteroidota bacterium]